MGVYALLLVDLHSAIYPGHLFPDPQLELKLWQWRKCSERIPPSVSLVGSQERGISQCFVFLPEHSESLAGPSFVIHGLLHRLVPLGGCAVVSPAGHAMNGLVRGHK